MEEISHPRGISVVIPTYNSAQFLARLLASIEQHRPPADSLEVLVVDDSAPEQAVVTQALCEKHGARYLWCQGNVSRKRNCGVEQASHPVVFFTDSDCEVAAGTLAEHLKLHNTGPEIGAMLGVVEFSGEANWVWSVVERTGFLGAYSWARRMRYAPWGGAGNLSVKIPVFRQTGGFDETFLRAPGGEDVDLGLRINHAGYKILCSPDAVVFHTRETWNTLRRMSRRVFGYGRAQYHLIRKHVDQAGVEYPGLAVVFFCVGLVSVARAAIGWHWLPLAGFVAFVLACMATQAFLVLRADSKPMSAFCREMLAHGLDLTYEFGVLYESLGHHDVRVFWTKIVFSERQLLFERQRKIIQAWSLVAGFLLLLLL